MAVTVTESLYPFDPTGTLLSNLIVGEQQIISPPNFRDYYFLIPAAAPYFANSLIITLKDLEGNVRPLVEGVDYYPSNWFISASRACALPIYGSISLLDQQLAGVVTLQYQTIGGIWTVTQQEAVEILANTVLNPRITAWDMVVNLPIAFPPINHEWDLVDMVGETELVAAIDSIADAVNASGGNALTNHIANLSNPHQVTATQVGLGNVQNYGVAVTADAVAGLRNDVYMTPAGVRAAVNSVAGTLVTNHINDHTNPHATTAFQVGLGNVSNYGTAGKADGIAGVSSTLFMTPYATAAAIANFATTTFAAHTSNYLNPHEVTSLQVGLGNVQNYSMASANDAQAGTRTDVYMTPYTVRQAITTLAGGDINAHILNYNNPHQVTAIQLGLGNIQNYGIADSPTTQAGVSTTLYTTPKGIVDAINNLVANDYHEHSVNVSNPHQVTAAQTGAYTEAQVNSLISGYMPLGSQASDSALFEGLALDQLAQYVLAGNASSATNATELNGRTDAQLKAWVLQGQASDAATLDGLTPAQIVSQALIGANSGATAQITSLPNSQVGSETLNWTLLGTVQMPDSANAVPDNPDSQWLVSGCDGLGAIVSATYFLRTSVRGAGTGAARLTLAPLNLSNTATGAVFGYVYDAVNHVASIYVRTANQRNGLSVTELAAYTGGTAATSATPVVTEPTGIVYVPEDAVATLSALNALESQVEGAINAMTAAFTTMITS